MSDVMTPDVNQICSENTLPSSDQSLKFLETLINLSPDILYIYDLNEQKNIYSNNGIQTVLGYSVEEIKDMGHQLIQILMHPDDFKVYVEQTRPRYALLKDGGIFLQDTR